MDSFQNTSGQNPSLEKVEKDYKDVCHALAKIKDVERYLIDLKLKSETLLQQASFCILQRNLKALRPQKPEGMLFGFTEIEKIFFQTVLPVLQPGRLSDDKAYKRNFQNEVLQKSGKIFREEASLVLKDQEALKNLQGFKRDFLEQEIGMIEISYALLMEALDQYISEKEKYLMIRYEKSLKYEDLPEIFFISLIKIDLLTITICCRKVPKSSEEKIVIFNLTYSTLFDRGVSAKFPKQRQWINIVKKPYMNSDPTMQGLLHVLNIHYDKLNLPCVYPRLGVYQAFSTYVMEKLEQVCRVYASNLRSNEERKVFITQVLNMILKRYPDELTEALEKSCIYCHRKFAKEGSQQKLIPCTLIRNDKAGCLHLTCKKVLDGKDAEIPRINVEVDATPPYNIVDTFLKF